MQRAAPLGADVGIPGDTRVQLAQGRWDIQARHRIGATLPVVLVAGGRLNEEAIGSSTLNGRLDVDWTNVPPLVRMLRTAGVVEISRTRFCRQAFCRRR